MSTVGGVKVQVAAYVDLAEAARLLGPEQLAALMAGIGAIVAVGSRDGEHRESDQKASFGVRPLTQEEEKG